jgi:microcystin-dependent protein
MSEPFIGQVGLKGFGFEQNDWAFCKGQILAINSYQALFSLISTFYGGDGRTTFALPDLRGKMAISQGRFPGSQFDWKMGQIRGEETHTMTLAELGEHAHLADYTPTGGPVKWEVSTSAATENVPTAGSYLAGNQEESIFQTGTSTDKVPLGGVGGGSGATKGNVTVGSSGNSQPFSIIQTIQVMNYSIAMKGLFPSRN